MGASSPTVTFLFTDIEASTRRWEADAPGMSAALARHDEILRAAVEAHGGEVFKHTGDGMCAVFTGAAEALAAALTAQRDLAAEEWGAPLRVRMALHTGSAERRADDYFGPALNRVARLLGTAHGGQVVVSAATAELTRDDLPAGAALADRGEHRLADLARPERVFQLAHPELPADFPPLRSLEVHRHNLPVALTLFVGRERELDEITGLLGVSRLVTLTGVGGGGKTRLAVETAARSLESFPDGAFFVELAPLTDPDLVASAVVGALELILDRPGSVLDLLCEHLATRRVLLVLDNCEHLVEAVATLVEALLRRCPEIVLLATGREPLGVAGESVWRIPSLSSEDAVALLCDRARAADPAFALNDANAVAVTQICQRLDGIPLALELAAARLHVLSPEEVAARLDDRFRLLTGGARTAIDRHRTLRATVDWGYELLSEPERALLRRLSVFAGGFDLDAAEAVGPDDKDVVAADVLDLLGSLIDRSWVSVEVSGGPTRYRLLESIRQYGAEKLAEAGQADEARRRHHHFFLGMTDASLQRVLALPIEWHRRIAVNEDNFRSALEWSFAAGDPQSLLRMAGGLVEHWVFSGQWLEGRAWLERALAATPSDATPEAARALSRLGAVLVETGEPDTGEMLLLRALACGDQETEGLVAMYDGIRALQRNQFDEAAGLMEASADSLAGAGSISGVAWCEFNLGWVAIARGDSEEAARHFERMLAMARRGGHDVLATHALAALAPLAAASGEAERARALAADAVDFARRFALRQVLIMTLTRAAETAVVLGEPARAVESLREAFSILRDIGARAWLREAFGLVAVVSAHHARHAEAARLLGAAQGLDRNTGESPRPQPTGVGLARRRVESVLGPERMATELAAGAAMTVDEAILFALEQLSDS